MSDNKQGTGIDRRGALECMIWAGTGVIWTLSGGVPKSSQLLGMGAAQAAEKAATGFSFLQISCRFLTAMSVSINRPIPTPSGP